MNNHHPPQAWLKIHLLGGCEFKTLQSPLRPETSKTSALLTYLVMNSGEQPRQKLSGLLWGDLPEAKAQRNLRRAVWDLQRKLAPQQGTPFLLCTRQSVAFNRDSDYWLDVEEFERKLRQAIRPAGPGMQNKQPTSTFDLSRLASCVQLYRGDFLDGFYVNEPAFEEWALIERERLRTLALLTLQQLVAAHTARGEYDAAQLYARRWLALNPWQEEAHRETMRLLMLSGQRSAALAQYEQCRQVLASELNMEPLDETIELYERIRDADKGSWTDLARPGDEPIPVPFVGREEQHATLLQWWQAAQHSQGRLALVEGEAGVGKTRLVEETTRYIEMQGALVLCGRCYEFGIGLPYQAIAEALQNYLKGQSGLASPGSPFSLPFVWLAELARLLPDLRQLFPDLAEPPLVSGETARQRLFEAVTRFVQALCSESEWSKHTSICLFLDDLHWADTSTLDLLHYLTRQLKDARVWLVGAFRPDETGPSHPLTRLRQGLSRDHLVNRLSLPALPAEAVEKIASTIVGKDHSVALGACLYRESEGNPFIMVETLYTLREQGALSRAEKGTWQWAGLPSGELLPLSVQDMILQRVGRLSESAQRLLALAAVIGRRFDAALLQSAGDAPLALVDASLDEWLSRRLVRLASTFNYDFSHDKIRAATYHTIETAQRQMLHRRVGQALEQQPPAPIETQVGLLAHHWEQAGESDRAINYLLRAGDQARLVYAHQEAIDYYERALALLKNLGEAGCERAARTLMRLGLTHHAAFDFERSRRAYAEGFVLWQRASASPPAALPLAPHALRLRWLEPTTLDPTMSPDAHTSNLMAQLFSGLVTLTPEMDITPDVARSWQISADGCRYTFHLRDDVRWSDETPVTAQDFEYGWKRALDPTIGSPAASFLYDIKGAAAFHRGKANQADVGIQAVDGTTLVVELEAPTGYFLQLLARTPCYPVPRHVLERHGQDWTRVENFVSNGPFRLAGWQQDKGLALARNPNYHNSFHGNVQQVELVPLPEWSNRWQRYEAGDLDVLGITHFPPAERETIRQQRAGEYISRPILETCYLVFDVSRPPFGDARVRQALALATDQASLADAALQGYVSPASGGIVPLGMPGHSPDIGLPYAPDRARQLLAEAGYPGGRGFPAVHALAFQAVQARVAYLQSQWQESLGVKIAWQTPEWETFLDQLKKEQYHILCAMWVADYPDPDNFLRVCRTETWVRWQNAHYDRLVEQARRVMDQKERLDLYRQATHILVKEAPILPLVYEREHLLIKTWVSRYPTAAGQTVFWKDVVIEPHA